MFLKCRETPSADIKSWQAMFKHICQVQNYNTLIVDDSHHTRSLGPDLCPRVRWAEKSVVT